MKVRGLVEYHILLASQWGGSGVSLQKTIYQRTKKKYSIGSIYTALYRLKRKGFLTSWKVKSTNRRGGRSSTYYGITERGSKEIDRLAEMTHRLNGDQG